MDSISYITQNHCHNAFNVISALLLVVMSLIAFGGIMGYVGVGCAAFFLLMSVLTYLYTRGSAKSCTMLQIPLIILSFTAFFAGIAMSALGFAIFHYKGMYDYFRSLSAQNGYHLNLPPQSMAAILCAVALLLFMMSFFAFCAIKYLNTVKICLNNEISRHGARIFSVASILMFVVTAAAAVVFVFSFGGWNHVIADRLSSFVLAEIAILAVLLLLSGLSSNSFISATYAFKVFEDKMMKVETNADGTVYVPVKEDSNRNIRPIPIPVSKPTQPTEPSGKPKKKLIKKASELDGTDTIDGTRSEYNIL